jgi:hypothetical protein
VIQSRLATRDCIQIRVPATRSLRLKYIMNIICTYIECLEESGNAPILFKTIENTVELTSTLPLNRYFGSYSVTTSGQIL